MWIPMNTRCYLRASNLKMNTHKSHNYYPSNKLMILKKKKGTNTLTTSNNFKTEIQKRLPNQLLHCGFSYRFLPPCYAYFALTHYCYLVLFTNTILSIGSIKQMNFSIPKETYHPHPCHLPHLQHDIF